MPFCSRRCERFDRRRFPASLTRRGTRHNAPRYRIRKYTMIKLTNKIAIIAATLVSIVQSLTLIKT
jgi:hypothetical protein